MFKAVLVLQKSVRHLKGAFRLALDTFGKAKCPICGRTTYRYYRQVHDDFCKDLKFLYKRFQNNKPWTAAKEMPPRVKGEIKGRRYGGRKDDFYAFYHLQKWGLIVGNGKKGKQGSQYCITPKGIDYVEGRISIPRIVQYVNKVVEMVSTERIQFEDGIKIPFDYRLLRSGKGSHGEVFTYIPVSEEGEY